MATVTLHVEETRKAEYDITIEVSNEDAMAWDCGDFEDGDIKEKYADAIAKAEAHTDACFEGDEIWEEVVDCDYDMEDE